MGRRGCLDDEEVLQGHYYEFLIADPQPGEYCAIFEAFIDENPRPQGPVVFRESGGRFEAVLAEAQRLQSGIVDGHTEEDRSARLVGAGEAFESCLEIDAQERRPAGRFAAQFEVLFEGVDRLSGEFDRTGGVVPCSEEALSIEPDDDEVDLDASKLTHRDGELRRTTEEGVFTRVAIEAVRESQKSFLKRCELFGVAVRVVIEGEESEGAVSVGVLAVLHKTRATLTTDEPPEWSPDGVIARGDPDVRFVVARITYYLEADQCLRRDPLLFDVFIEQQNGDSGSGEAMGTSLRPAVAGL